MPDSDPIRSLAVLQDSLLGSASTDEFLQELVVHAVAGLPPRAGSSCSLTVLREGTPVTAASSDDLARTVDQLQYTLDEGPCLDAIRLEAEIAVLDLQADVRWPAFGPQVLIHDISACLATPVLVLGQSTGALNLYLQPSEQAGPLVQDWMRHYASQIGSVLGLSLRLEEQIELARDLRAALTSRSVIDMAKGVIMGQNRCTSDQAFAILRAASSRRNEKLRDIAAQIITSVTGQAPDDGPEFRWPR